MDRASRALLLGLLFLLPPVGCRSADAVRELGPEFDSGRFSANGVTLHYVRGGSGPALILLHGFPEDWTAWRRILPRLARSFDVVAVDLRGIGASAPANSGFDIATMAEDVFELGRRLGLERPAIAGHDVGAMVAYAYARLHPDAVRCVVFADALVPGVDPWEELRANPEFWHFGFLQSKPLADELLLGKENVFVREFIRGAVLDPAAIDDADLARYARAYTGTDRLNAALGQYRAFPENERFGASHREPIDVPLVVVAGEKGPFGPRLAQMAEAFRAHGWRVVTTESVANAVHYLLDEQPDAIARLIEHHAAPSTRGK